MRSPDLIEKQIVNVTQLRRNWSAIIRKVERGEAAEIVRHGRPVARLVSVLPRWKRPGPRISIPGVSASKLIIEERQSGL